LAGLLWLAACFNYTWCEFRRSSAIIRIIIINHCPAHPSIHPEKGIYNFTIQSPTRFSID